MRAVGTVTVATRFSNRYLKDGDNSPEKIVEILAPASLRSDQCRVAELAAEQMHSENAAQDKATRIRCR